MNITDFISILDTDEKSYQDDKIYHTLNDILCDTIQNLSIIIYLKGLDDEFKDNIVLRSILLVNVLSKAICIIDREMAENLVNPSGGANEKKND